ncbi:MAG: hypothetical protein P8Y85_07535 [Nitrospirota bacterium]|jgi:predicted nuclease with TOPRIM domain
MREEKIVQERLKLIERELSTLSEALDRLERKVSDLGDLRDEIKALKMCLVKLQPAFKDEFLEAMKKVTEKG